MQMGKTEHSSQRKIVQICSCGTGKDPDLQQLPSSPHHPWNQKYTFLINRSVEKCDYFVLLFFLPPIRVRARVPQKNTLFIYGEVVHGSPLFTNLPLPPQYNKFFNTIVNHCAIEDIENTIDPSGTGGVWRIPHSYDQLAQQHSVKKRKLLSVICSALHSNENYRTRLQFVAILKEHFKDRIDHFGRGINPLHNKWHGIAPYKYSVVMENNTVNGYWTEKLSDTFSGLSYPFYYGAPNIYSYFTPKMLTPIDITRPYEAVEIIERGIAANLYEKRLEHLKVAKDMILNKYNLFAVIDRYISDHQKKYPTQELERQYVTFNYRPPWKDQLNHQLRVITGVDFLSLMLIAKRIMEMLVGARTTAFFTAKLRTATNRG